jgi:hypothetical protein
MTESSTPEHDDETSDADSLRQHSQDPAEGPDGESDDEKDVPREHTQDPAEG